MLKDILDYPDSEDQFRQLCLYCSELLAKEGKRVRPFRSPELPVFSALPPEKKREAVERISVALEIFEETRAEGFSLKDSPKLVWRAIRKFGWIPQSDIFDKIADGDVVILYSADQIQIFQNLNFFDWVSLTLEDLYGAPWHQYTKREVKAVESLYQYVMELVAGVRRTTFSTGIPEHYVEEVGTEELQKFYIEVRYMSPLTRDGKLTGCVVVNRCRAWDGVPCASPLF